MPGRGKDVKHTTFSIACGLDQEAFQGLERTMGEAEVKGKATKASLVVRPIKHVLAVIERAKAYCF